MNRAAYNRARRLIRGNGRYALRWMSCDVRDVMERLLSQEPDPLKGREQLIRAWSRAELRTGTRGDAVRVTSWLPVKARP